MYTTADQRSILNQLITVLESCGVDIRREALDDSCGGLCTVRGRLILFLNSSEDPGTSARVCARALARAVDLETVYLRPEVRRYIDHILAQPEDRPQGQQFL